jgi:cell division control protein 6
MYERQDIKNAKVSVFKVTSYRKKVIVDPNVATIFHPIEVEFRPYIHREMYHILKERCRLGFYKDVISDEIIHEVAQRSYDRGDVRYGLKLLAEIGEKAERLGSGKIQKEHLYEIENHQ